MSEVYRALQVLQFEWQNLSPYRIRARCLRRSFVLSRHGIGSEGKPAASLGNAAAAAVAAEAEEGDYAIIILQLYKIQQSIYLLDFQVGGVSSLAGDRSRRLQFTVV